MDRHFFVSFPTWWWRESTCIGNKLFRRPRDLITEQVGKSMHCMGPPIWKLFFIFYASTLSWDNYSIILNNRETIKQMQLNPIFYVNIHFPCCPCPLTKHTAALSLPPPPGTPMLILSHPLCPTCVGEWGTDWKGEVESRGEMLSDLIWLQRRTGKGLRSWLAHSGRWDGVYWAW